MALLLHKYEVSGNIKEVPGVIKKFNKSYVWLTPRQVKRYKKRGANFYKLTIHHKDYEPPKEV